MPELIKTAKLARKVRTIAKGIFDHKERRVVLKFVADVEKLAAKRAEDLKSSLGTRY